MARYAAPLADIRFALYDVLDVESLFKRLPGCETATRDVVDAVLDEAAKFTEQVLAPLNQTGDQEGCHFDAATASVTTPAGFQEGLRAIRRERLGRPHRAGGVRRTGDAAGARRRGQGNARFGESLVGQLSAAVARRDRSAAAARRGLAARSVPETDRRRPLDRHDVPDRAALRHRSRPAEDQGRTRRRRQLPHQRHEDLHHRRRARFHREHRASRARATARCAGRRERHLAVHRAEVQGRPRRQARRRATRSRAARSSTRWASRARRRAR